MTRIERETKTINENLESNLRGIFNDEQEKILENVLTNNRLKEELRKRADDNERENDRRRDDERRKPPR